MYANLGALEVSNLMMGPGVTDVTSQFVAGGGAPNTGTFNPTPTEALYDTEGKVAGSGSGPEDVFLTDQGMFVSGAELAKTEPTVPLTSAGTPATPRKWYKSPWFIGGMAVLAVAVVGGVVVSRRRG